MDAILQVKDLSKTFGTRKVLQGLNFSVARGSSLAITGPSGCGKSTLLNIIGLLESPSSGSVLLEGKQLPKINSLKATRLRREKINYLFQSYALVTDKTAMQNAMLGLHYTKLSKVQKREQILEMFEKLDLGVVANEKVSTLSGGEQQRLAAARCMLKPGELILADEPTGALDHALAMRVFDQILTLQREHKKTLMIVTHDLELASRCDEVLELRAQ